MDELTVRTTRIFIIVALSVASSLEGADMSKQEELFQQANIATGGRYVNARDELLELGSDVQAFLETQAGTSSDPEVSWLAEILLARLAHHGEFARLEKDFDEKVRFVKFGYPRRSRGGWPLKAADTLIGLRTPEEPLPIKTTMGGEIAPHFLEFHRKTRICASDCWKAFLSEVLLKDWRPTSVPLAAAPKALTEQELDENRMPRDPKPTLASDDYVRQAVLLLGKLGEKRAVPRIVELLANKSQDGRTRLVAARALGYLKTDLAIETLLRLVEAEQTPPRIRIEVFEALARLKDERAVPVLERIAADPDDTPLRGAYGPARWKSEARSVLMKIREK